MVLLSSFKDMSSFVTATAQVKPTLDPAEQAYVASSEKPVVVTQEHHNLENYEDYDIPAVQFKTPLPHNFSSSSSLSVERNLAPAQIKEIAALSQQKPQQAVPLALPEQPRALASTVVSKDTTPSASTSATTWYQYQVVRGDNLSKIFAKLALPQASLKLIIATAPQETLALQIGQVLHFGLNPDDTLQALVLPQDERAQWRFARQQNQASFNLIREARFAHLATAQEANTLAQANKMPKLKATTTAQTASQDKATSSLRPRLIYGSLQDGESFKHFAYRLGLTATEIQTIAKMYASNGKLSALQAGDSLRVLFDGPGTRALINAVEIERRGEPKLTFYRNLADKNYYEEHKYVPTAGIFRRFPLATAIQINSPFNLRRHHPVTGRSAPHQGVDIKAPIGTPVYAPADGVVTFAGYQRAAGYYVIVRHVQDYSTVYMHLSKIEVKKGQSVYAGQQIAKTGNTGRTTGPHLHYEIRIQDRPYDPLSVKLPTSEHNEQVSAQREAFKSNVAVFKSELYNEALAQNH